MFSCARTAFDLTGVLIDDCVVLDCCTGGNEKQLKRAREEENVWEDFASIQSSVFDELSSILRSIDSAEVIPGSSSEHQENFKA